MSHSFESNRFAFGGWPNPPFMDKWRILYNFPERHKELVKLRRESLQKKDRELEVMKDILSTYKYAMNEAHLQSERLSEQIEELADDVIRSFEHLETFLGAHLDEFKRVLVHIDDNLSSMLQILQAPLGTKARELTTDGAKALSRGFLDEARICFEMALEHKPSDCEALTLLGFTSHRMGKLDMAIGMFGRVVAFVPFDSGGEPPALAYENLARAYFVKGDYHKAYEYQSQALSIRDGYHCKYLPSEYCFSIYSFLSDNLNDGFRYMENLCEIQPSYFLTFITDKDLEPRKREILNNLNELAQTTYERVNSDRKEVSTDLNITMGKLKLEYPEYQRDFDFVTEALARTEILLERQTYCTSVEAGVALHSLSSIGSRLGELMQLRRKSLDIEKEFNTVKTNLSTAQDNYEAAKREFESTRRAKIENTEINITWAKWLVYIGLGALGTYIIIDVLIDAWKEVDKNFFSVFATVIGLLILIPVLCVIIYGAGLVIGFVITAILNGIRNLVTNSLWKKTLDQSQPNAEQERFNAVKCEKYDAETKLKQLESFFQSEKERVRLAVRGQTKWASVRRQTKWT